jgi:putative hemolysin
MGIWIIIFLIVINGTFVLIEMALVSSRRGRLEARAERGDRGARVALRLLERPTMYLSTVQIGMTLTGVLLGAFGEEAVADKIAGRVRYWYPGLTEYAHVIGLGATVVSLTFVIIVAAELVPKRLAQIAPETFAALGSRPMWFMSRVCAPLVWALSASTNVILKVVPLRTRADQEMVVEDVKALVASGTETGVFHATEQQIVERVFRLSDQSVKAIMVPRTDVDILLVDDSVQRIRVVVATSSHSHFPVCKTGLDDLIGVVHVKDLVKQSLIGGGAEDEGVRLADALQPPLFVPENTPAIKMLETFRKERTHIAFVLDEYGVLEGLVTLSDVVEALVGEVTRRGEVEDPEIVKRADGSYLLDGMLGVGELKELMGVDALPKEEEAGYETLGGLVMTYLGRIPATGDTFSWDRFKFEVVDMDKARVDKVMLVCGPERNLEDAVRHEGE